MWRSYLAFEVCILLGSGFIELDSDFPTLKINITAAPASSRGIAMEAADFVVGFCQVQLKYLEPHAVCVEVGHWRRTSRGRRRSTHTLRKVFDASESTCKPHSIKHSLPVLVDSEELEGLLANSGVSLRAVTESRPPYLKITPQRKLQFIHGKKRYEAAIGSRVGPDAWWTVKLLCAPSGINPRALFRDEIDQYHYQQRPSDGEIIFQRRQCAAGSPEEALWGLKLKGYKPKHLDILKNKWNQNLWEAFARLSHFPGLLTGFMLGNVQRYKSLHVDDMMVHCLTLFYNEWTEFIASGQAASGAATSLVGSAANSTTVELLEMRAPSVSTVDRREIENLMREGVLFPAITDPALRSHVEQSILRAKGLIYSVRCLCENMKYLAIAVSIIRSHLKIDLPPGLSFYQAVGNIWSKPPGCLIEWAEFDFRTAPCAPSLDVSFLSLFLSALRRFWQLQDAHGPRCEGKPLKPSVDPEFKARFLYQAKQFGFGIPEGQRVATLPEIEHYLEEEAKKPPVDVAQESSRERRWGRPYESSAHYLASHLFLPELVRRDEQGLYPNTLFIQRDFLYRFLGAHLSEELKSVLRQNEAHVAMYGLQFIAADRNVHTLVNSTDLGSMGVVQDLAGQGTRDPTLFDSRSRNPAQVTSYPTSDTRNSDSAQQTTYQPGNTTRDSAITQLTIYQPGDTTRDSAGTQLTIYQPGDAGNIRGSNAPTQQTIYQPSDIRSPGEISRQTIYGPETSRSSISTSLTEQSIYQPGYVISPTLTEQTVYQPTFRISNFNSGSCSPVSQTGLKPLVLPRLIKRQGWAPDEFSEFLNLRPSRSRYARSTRSTVASTSAERSIP